MNPNLADDELALRSAFEQVVASASPSRTTSGDVLDRAVVCGRRRRVLRRSAAVVSSVGGLVVVGLVVWSFLPPTGAPSSTTAPATSGPSVASPAPSSPAPSPSGSAPYGSSGVDNADWPTASVVDTIARRVVASAGGTVLSQTEGVDYYEPPVSYDSQRKPLWALGSHLRSRSVELAVSTSRGDYVVDVMIDGNSPKDPDGSVSAAYFPPSFDMSVGTPGVTALIRQKDRKVFAYANKAFPERKTIQAMVWRPDGLLLTVVVTNYGVELPGGMKALGPDWKSLGLTAKDLLDAVG